MTIQKSRLQLILLLHVILDFESKFTFFFFNFVFKSLSFKSGQHQDETTFIAFFFDFNLR